MLNLNELAERCRENALSRHMIGADSSLKGLALGISINWRRLWTLPEEKRKRKVRRKKPRFSEREYIVADIIISAIVYLESIGCDDIELLLRQKAKRNEK